MLEFKNVSKSFGSINALTDVSFLLDPAEFVFLTGPSGAGKTTLLKLLIREYLPTEGSIFLEGKDISELKRRDIPFLRQNIGSVFQDYALLDNQTVKENLILPLAVKRVSPSEWDERVAQVLELVGLSERESLFPRQLSGGEQQRAGLARALILDPAIIFADEPTGNLDWETALSIMSLLQKINEEGKTVIVTTHNRDIVDKMKKREIKLEKGRLIHDSDPKHKHKKEKD